MNTFKLTENHLKLLKNMNVRWEDCEYGAPSIDGKRPYGNSDVEQDMVELLGCTKDPNTEDLYIFNLYGKRYALVGEDEFNLEIESEKLIDALYELHKETEIALQICLQFQEFKTGTFQREDSYGDWEKVK